MKKHLIEKNIEQNKEPSKLQLQEEKKKSVWQTIRKILLNWSRVDPKI
ncbi:MAG: hypothetical protein JJE25_01530 [Bacteroidia bacterium]|nr:hypothetical protein [Bacteroidia bacterium]